MTSKPAARKAAAKYRLKFVPDAWREWQALDGSIKQALKPLKQGYRLVYLVEDDELVVLVLSVGNRADSAAYQMAAKRRK